MLSSKIISGIISAYLVAAPCLLIDHSGDNPADTGSVATAHADHQHGENTEEDTDEQEHCCEDLSGSIHAPLKQIPTAIVAFVAVLPSFDIPVAYVHLDGRIALSRDGPLHEQASEFAKTIVMRS